MDQKMFLSSETSTWFENNNQSFWDELKSLDFDEQCNHFLSLNLEKQFNLIKEIQEKTQDQSLWALFIYLFRSQINNVWKDKLITFIKYLHNQNSRITFDNIRLFRTILTYINLNFEETIPNKILEDAKLNKHSILTIWSILQEICNTPLLNLYNKITLQTLEEQLTNRDNTQRVANNYQAIKVKWNNIAIKWKKYGTISRISSDFISFWTQQKSLWLTSYTTEEENSFSQEEVIYNDAFRLFDNIFEIYIQDKYANQIKTKQDILSYYENESLPKDFSLQDHAKTFLTNIVFYILDNPGENKDKIQEVLQHIFWKEKSQELTYALENILEYYQDFTNPLFELRQTLLTKTNSDLKQKVISIFQNALIGSNIITLIDFRELKNLQSYESYLSSPLIDIYGNENTQTIALLMENIHEPQFLQHLNQDIWFDIRTLSLQIQVHLIRYLWESDLESYNNFKKAVKSATNKSDFINTFLTCSKKLDTWNSIIKISEIQWSERIYEYSSKIIALQNQFKISETEMNGMLKTIVNRLTRMFEYLHANIEKDFDINTYKTLSLYLWNSSLKIKQLVYQIKNWVYPSISDFNRMKTGFKLDYFQGWTLVKSGEEIDMQMPDNYINPEILSVKKFNILLQWIDLTHSSMDPSFMNFATPYMWNDFNNPKCNFLFLQEELQQVEKLYDKDEDENLSGTSKVEDKWSHYYFWTHYLREDLQWDFSIWLFLEKMIQKEACKKDIPVTGTIMLWNKVFIQRIEWKWDIGIGIERYNNWKTKPFLKVMWNYPYEFISKTPWFKLTEVGNYDNMKVLNFNISNNNYKELELKSQIMFQKGYVITRTITDSENPELIHIIYEKPEEN